MPFLAHAKTIYRQYRITFMWKVFGKRIDRNQWSNMESSSWEIHNKLMMYSWEETESNAPQYFQRLNFVIKKCEGRVLEIGCGIGAMTRWICKSNKVMEVVAIDAFQEPIKKLKSHNLPKVTALQMSAQNIQLHDTTRFDTVVMCELIEHIYPDEEKKMLNALRRYIDERTAFIVSTPIGRMFDPHHVRGFSEKKFKKHLRKHYGVLKEIDLSSGYSQVAFGYFKHQR